MASISNQPGGRRTIQFIGPDGTRKSIRLGKMPKKAAEAVKLKVEQLVAAAMSGHAVDDETARWVAGLDKVMAEKLAAVGLIPEREAANLHDFIDGYITSRRDVKPNTVKIWRQTLRLLIEHFGRDRPLRSIAHGEAKDWRLFLIGRPMADATVRKHCGFAKHFFAEAVDRGLVERNPFTKIVSSPVGNPSRQFFVTREAIQKVIDACPDAEWRLIVALSRFGALRCPSEHLKLRWDDIDWGRSRMTVRSPKTERHEGHESREVPIFPELLPYLEDAFDRADPGAEYVIAKRRNSEGNLRTHLRKIVKRAGLQPWPRIFHNLRASRQTKLEEQFPTHVVCAWVGNSPLVARKHYLQVRDSDFEKAAGALQNPVQQPAAMQRICSAILNSVNAGMPKTQPVAMICGNSRTLKAGVDGNRTHQTSFQRFHWV